MAASPPDPHGAPGAGDAARRERRARLLGVAVALLAMAAAVLTIRWPAPGVSALLGYGAYLAARGRG